MPFFSKPILLWAISLFLFLSPSLAQEFLVKGRVLDAETHEPLAFVNIISNAGPMGAATDIDGKFLVRDTNPIKTLRISYIGYEPMVFEVRPDGKDQTVNLQKSEVLLEEVVIRPGINPAHKIIRKVLENRFLNDHERMESFAYSSYEKITFGPENDTLPWSDAMALDSSAIRMKKFFDRQYLFIMESVAERKFLFPDKNYNKVIASRISGFGDPLFIFLMSQIQSTSFYKETITISDKQYINPISSGTLSKYNFELVDTLVEPWPYDTTYIMTFRPLLQTNFDGLKGVISISTNGYAIRNVIAEPARLTGNMTIKIQQLYDFMQDEHWFPLQLNTDIVFKNVIGNGNITIGKSPENPASDQSDLVGRGKSYISNIRLNPAFKKSQFGFVEVDVQPDAFRKPEHVWEQYRVDSLTIRELNTYHIMDSIGKARHFDRLGYKLDAIMNGKMSIGFMYLEMDKILKWNRFEGTRLGAGMHTNEKFSKIIQLGAYGGYGFKDHKIKYGGNAEILFNRLYESKVGFSYEDDLNEAGLEDPFMNNKLFTNPENYRQLLVSRMDHAKSFKIALSSRFLNYTKVELSLLKSHIIPQYDYGYITHRNEGLQVISKEFDITEANIQIRFAYGEKFMRNSRSLVSMGTTYPIVWLNLAGAFNGMAGGQYSYKGST
ncbi:MAG: carboxypeptidase-like regulatory domain-containing protein [Bacteroidales bacterium]|nr:carboxypeptidase-like regulatory domain-containing protein [Bacteroidales bacterium]